MMDGIRQASSLFVQDLESGLEGISSSHQRRERDDEEEDVIFGKVRGVAGMVVSPLVATLDALSSVTGGVESTVRKGLDDDPLGGGMMRRRRRRVCLEILTEDDMMEELRCGSGSESDEKERSDDDGDEKEP